MKRLLEGPIMRMLPFLFPHSAVSRSRSVSEQEIHLIMQNKRFCIMVFRYLQADAMKPSLPLRLDRSPETICPRRPGLRIRHQMK